MTNENAQIRAALDCARVTAGWSASAAKELGADSEIKTYANGERVLSAGDEVDALWIVVEGSLLLSKTWPNGHRLFYAFLKSGQSTGILSVFDGLPASFDVTARANTKVLFVPGQSMRAVAKHHPDVAERIIAYLCRSARADFEAVELHAMNSVRCRIAKAILVIAREQTQSGDYEIALDSRISQEDLADIVCAARQSVNRELRRLIREGILKQRYRALVILDRKALERVAVEDEGRPPSSTKPLNALSNHLFPATD